MGKAARVSVSRSFFIPQRSLRVSQERHLPLVLHEPLHISTSPPYAFSLSLRDETTPRPNSRIVARSLIKVQHEGPKGPPLSVWPPFHFRGSKTISPRTPVLTASVLFLFLRERGEKIGASSRRCKLVWAWNVFCVYIASGRLSSRTFSHFSVPKARIITTCGNSDIPSSLGRRTGLILLVFPVFARYLSDP